MVNTDTLKVTLDADTGLPAIDPATGSYIPIDPDEVEHGNAVGTKRYAYLAKESPLYAYYADKLDLCATSDSHGDIDGIMLDMPGSTAHERWYRFINTEGSTKTVCISSDGRLLDGDVSASRSNIQLQTYTKPDGTKSAWVLLSYEESKGMGHSLAAEAHDEGGGDTGEMVPGEGGQDKPIRQDFGKNVIYHSFDFTQPDLVSAGHIVNLPALCGGLYPNYCDDADNPTCTCTPGLPIPLYFDEYVDNGDGTGEWMPDETKFLQFRTEIARRARFFSQAPGKAGPSGTVANIIFKQGQEGMGRPADVFTRRIVNQGGGNPYRFENFQCTTYLDETFDLPSCPNGAGSMPSDTGYMCNVWGEASGDRLCGGKFADPIWAMSDATRST